MEKKGSGRWREWESFCEEGIEVYQKHPNPREKKNQRTQARGRARNLSEEKWENKNILR